MKTIELRHKDKNGNIKVTHYVTVSERVKALRKEHGFNVSIITEMLKESDNEVIFKASLLDSDGRTIATGTAKERQDGTWINKGSHIENCETSAVGRCLAFAGFGIDAEIASADEIFNSDYNSPISDSQRNTIERMLDDCTLSEYDIKKIEDALNTMTHARADDCIEYLSNHIQDHIEGGKNYQQKDIHKKLDEKLNDPKA